VGPSWSSTDRHVGPFARFRAVGSRVVLVNAASQFTSIAFRRRNHRQLVRRLLVACLASVPYDSQTKTASMPQPVAYQLVDPLLESMTAQSALAALEGCEAYHALNRPP
jgi:hypothetical protein